MIQTTRLLLRPMSPDDADDLLAIFADPVAMASFGGVLFDRPQMVRWVRGLEHLEIDGPEVELGYDIRSDYWGRGLATEATAAVRDYALRELNLQRLISLIRHGNAASRRVAEKIGMRHVEDVTRHGHGYWLYALTREDAEGGDAGDPRESESSGSPEDRLTSS